MFRLKFQMSMSQFEGLKKYRTLRKDRARMLGAIRERELTGSTGPVKPALPRKPDIIILVAYQILMLVGQTDDLLGHIPPGFWPNDTRPWRALPKG